MARHQYGIFAEGTRAHHHLELELDASAYVVKRAFDQEALLDTLEQLL